MNADPRREPLGLTAAWAQYLSATAAGASTPGVVPPPQLTAAEANRVQRHRDRLMMALQAQDRAALLRAKQDVLEDAYCARATLTSGPEPGGCEATARNAESPALRRALRDLSWRMTALLVPRSPRH